MGDDVKLQIEVPRLKEMVSNKSSTKKRSAHFYVVPEASDLPGAQRTYVMMNSAVLQGYARSCRDGVNESNVPC